MAIIAAISIIYARINNEEINLVVYDAGFAGQLERSFQEDLKYSKKLTYEVWNSRPFIEKILELFTIPIKEQL